MTSDKVNIDNINYTIDPNGLCPKSISYHHVVPNSHFWTSIEQIIAYLKQDGFSKEHLITGLENMVKEGYEIKKEK